MAAVHLDLRRLLEDARDDRAAAGLTLREQLRAREREIGEAISGGSLSSISKNSVSQSYSFSGSGALTTVEIARAYRTLIDLYDSVSAGLGTDDDEVIYREMFARLEPCRGFTKDFTMLQP